MKTFILTPLVVLAACASTASFQQRTPAATFTSDDSRLALEECIALRLSWLGTPSTIRGEERTVMVYGQPSPALTVTLSDGAQRTVDVRAAVSAGSRVRRDVGACV